MNRRGTAALLCTLALAGGLCRPAKAVGTAAASAILVEQGSGRVLWEHNAHEERLIASITKIMTAVVALEEGDLSAVYTVTAEDMAEGSSMYLRPGEQVGLEELLYGLLLASGNDAALAVARCVAGNVERFVALMNEKAEALGMEHTHFANPNGLDAPDHRSTAADMARLAAYALEDQTFCRIVSTSAITLGERTLTNHNKLLRRYEGCIGVKTGYTRAAGRTLVSAARRGDMTLVCVTLSDGDDWNDHTALLDWGFGTWQLVTAAAAGQAMARVSVRGGTEREVPLLLERDLACPLTGEETMTVTVETPVSVGAPVVPGQAIGRARIWVDGQPVAEAALVAGAASARREV